MYTNEENKMKIRKRLKNVLFSVLILCVSLAISASAVFAWFDLRNDSDLRGFKINVTSKDVSNVALKTYAISDITTGAQTDYTLAIKDNNYVPLHEVPVFDSLGIALNDYKTSLAINLTFSVHKDATYAVYAEAAEQVILGTENWLSNCARFLPTNFSSGILTSSDVPKSFVTVQENTLSKTQRIEILRAFCPQGEVSFWFVLEYHADAVNIIKAANSEAEEETIFYSNDIRFEMIAL